MDHQPRPGVRPKKRRRDRLIALATAHPDWALGFADEVWWSRLAQPHLHAWAEADHPLRLVEQTVAKDDPDPKALACYGVLLRRARQDEAVWLRFVDGRPVSALTTPFLDWCCGKLAAQGVPVWVLIWDNASWHVSQRGARLDPRPQPSGQAPGPGRPHPRLLPAGQESLAQPD